jgi:hypothetical protein
MSTSNITSLAISRNAGIVLNVTAFKDVMSSFDEEWIRSYQTMGISSTLAGGDGAGCLD